MRARHLPPLLIPLAAIVLLSAIFLVARYSDGTWNSIRHVAQQGLMDAQVRLNEVGGKVLDTASSLADNPAPVESPTPTQVIVFAEPSLEDQAVRVALAAQETPAAELVIAPTTVSTRTAALTVTAPITTQAVALADVQSGVALEMQVSPTPVAQEPALAETPASSPSPTIAQATATRSGPAVAIDKPAASTAAQAPPTATATSVPPTATPTATPAPPTATATALPPTATPTATPAPPTATPSATALPPTATPRVKPATASAEETIYVVVSGDNWYSIARRFGITQEALAAANGTTSSDILQVDQRLQIPAANAEPARSSQSDAKGASAATPTATVVIQTYTVQRGDNWFTIAKRFGITQEALAVYNNRSASDILQVNQKLRIPPAGTAVAKPTPEATKTVRPSPTTTAEPTPTAERPTVVRLPAPVLLAPGNQDGFSADTLPVLTWQPVSGLVAGDYYYVVVRFELKNGELGFVPGETTDTSFTVPRWVFDQAQTPDRIGRWSVQVRRLDPAGEAIEISPASETRSFYWR